MRKILVLTCVLCLMILVVFQEDAGAADKPILIGYPIILSGGGSYYGQPCLKGSEIAVKEINDKGGILGRPLKLVVRDSKSTPAEATRVAKELILNEKVDFMIGGILSHQGLALSEVAKNEKILYIAPFPKTTAMTDPENFHPYVFRTGANTNTEGRSAAVVAAKLPVKRVYTVSPDYEYGIVLTKAFVDWIKKIKPEVEIVGQSWPKIDEKDYSPYINKVLAAKPDTVFLAVWGELFAAFSKQAQPYGFFKKMRVIAGAESGSIEMAISLKDDLPIGITTNAYDLPYYPDTPEHKNYIKRLKNMTGEEYPSGFSIQGYISIYFLAEAIKKAKTTDTKAVIKALEGLTIDTPIGKQTIRAKDHQATRGQLWGTTAKVPEYPFPILRPVEYIPADKLMD
jgi:branched-chain amino acid transport system substrate-binding protein